MNQFIERLSVVSFANSAEKKRKEETVSKFKTPFRIVEKSVNSPRHEHFLQTESVIADLCCDALAVAEMS